MGNSIVAGVETILTCDWLALVNNANFDTFQGQWKNSGIDYTFVYVENQGSYNSFYSWFSSIGAGISVQQGNIHGLLSQIFLSGDGTPLPDTPTPWPSAGAYGNRGAGTGTYADGYLGTAVQYNAQPPTRQPSEGYRVRRVGTTQLGITFPDTNLYSNPGSNFFRAFFLYNWANNAGGSQPNWTNVDGRAVSFDVAPPCNQVAFAKGKYVPGVGNVLTWDNTEPVNLYRAAGLGQTFNRVLSNTNVNTYTDNTVTRQTAYNVAYQINPICKTYENPTAGLLVHLPHLVGGSALRHYRGFRR